MVYRDEGKILATSKLVGVLLHIKDFYATLDKGIFLEFCVFFYAFKLFFVKFIYVSVHVKFCVPKELLLSPTLATILGWIYG